MKTFALAALLLIGAQARPGTVEVTIKHALTGEGLAGVPVVLTSYFLEPPNPVKSVTTDRNGRAVFSDLDNGTHVLRIEPEGYVLPRGQTAVPSLSENLIISPDTPRHQREVILTPVATVSGRVLGPNGLPMVEALVRLVSVTYINGLRILSSGAAALARDETDDRGEYRLAEVPAGEYYVEVDNLHSLMTSDAEDHVAKVSYYPGTVDVVTATPIAVRGQDMTAIDVRVPAARAYKVSGTVFNLRRFLPDLPVEGGFSGFYIVSANPNGLDAPTLLLSRSVPSSDPSEFKFEIGGITPGTYHLYPLGGGSASRLPKVRATVTVADHDVEDLRIVLEPGQRVPGRITATGEIPGIRWDGVGVGVISKERLPSMYMTIGNALAFADPNTHEFRLEGLVPDARYGITVGGLPANAYVADIRQGARSVFNDGVILPHPSAGEIEIVIDPRGGTVRGLVFNTSSQPVAGAAVVLVPAAPRRGNSQLYKRRTTDSAGQFTLSGVAPGDYKLFAWSVPPVRLAEENAQFLARYEARGTPVRVTAGGTTESQLVTVIPLQ